jgi:glutamate racemase
VPDSRPIGVFDSGVGGLTVARAIFDLLPREPILYAGDSARSPYGPKPLAEIRSYALEIAGYLVSREVKLLVVACNSVEVAAIREVTEAAVVPVVGVIDPGVRAAIRATRNGRIGMIGTEATVASGAYDRAVADSGAKVQLTSQACPAFVEHVQRGDTSSSELLSTAREYLSPLRDDDVDVLILGCTHYPMLSGMIQMVIGQDVVLVSSAEETAKDVYAMLRSLDLLRDEPSGPRHEYRCTGDPGQFLSIAQHFLGPTVGDVEGLVVQPVGGAPWS